MVMTVKEMALDSPEFQLVWRQVVDGPDTDRLLPTREKRRRDLVKRLERPMDKNGWRMFVSGCAYTMQNGKARQARNAELVLIETIARWRAQVLELLPDREADLKQIVRVGLMRPEPPPNRD